MIKQLINCYIINNRCITSILHSIDGCVHYKNLNRSQYLCNIFKSNKKCYPVRWSPGQKTRASLRHRVSSRSRSLFNTQRHAHWTLNTHYYSERTDPSERVSVSVCDALARGSREFAKHHELVKNSPLEIHRKSHGNTLASGLIKHMISSTRERLRGVPEKRSCSVCLIAFVSPPSVDDEHNHSQHITTHAPYETITMTTKPSLMFMLSPGCLLTLTVPVNPHGAFLTRKKYSTMAF